MRVIMYVARNENNSLIGGVFGVAYLSALEVEVLWVHEDYRYRFAIIKQG